MACLPAHCSLLKHLPYVQEGHSVLAHIKGFWPYFYVAVPRGFETEDIHSFMSDLNVRQNRLATTDILERTSLDIGGQCHQH